MSEIETPHAVVSQSEWLAARKALLEREKSHTRERDALAAARRALPWVRVDKAYAFEGAHGRVGLADLFDGRRQLIVHHFMFGPGWKEGCVGCSLEADHIDDARQHLEHHDLTLVAVSRAPFAEIEAFRRRMGWGFTWVSSAGSDFNFDFHVSFKPEEAAAGSVYYNYDKRPFVSEELSGRSAFLRDASGAIFHTYSAYARGTESVLGVYSLLDMAPLGRNETGPRGDLRAGSPSRTGFGTV